MFTTELRVIDPRAPRTSRRVTTWEAVRPLYGIGSVLLGPDMDGVLALIPPGTLALTPHESDPYTTRGWREARWTGGDHPSGFLLRTPPQTLRQVSFLHIALVVQYWAPAHRAWLERRVREHLGSLSALVNGADLDAEELSELQTERDDLLIDAATVFGSDRTRSLDPA